MHCKYFIFNVQTNISFSAFKQIYLCNDQDKTPLDTCRIDNFVSSRNIVSDETDGWHAVTIESSNPGKLILFMFISMKISY
jgi:hypothetical protein